MYSQVDAEPVKGTVAILEDEPTVSDDLEREISSLGYDVVGIADSLEDFERIVRAREPDVVSIDWLINGVDQGPEALDFMHREHSICGRLVYTKYRDRARGAKKWGADEVVLKRAGSVGLNEYIDSVKRVTKVSLLRRIIDSLKDLGVAVGITLAQVTRPLDCEGEIFELSRKTVVSRRVNGEDPVLLRTLLQRRGWWQALDLNTFIVLPWPRKLAQLIQPLDLSPHSVASILGVKEESARELVFGESLPRGLEREELERVDFLLSVLAHLLRISQYEVEMMQYYWNTKNLYGSSVRQPPWDRQGLGEFLIERGPSGLADALSWIRR